MEEEKSHRRKIQAERKWGCEPLKGSREEILGQEVAQCGGGKLWVL